MDPSIAQAIQAFAVSVLPIVIAITFHEVAHGFVADKKGDATARLMGRLTLNPIAHIDPVGTILVPALLFFTSGFLFGWAKPVPVNFMNLHHPKRDMVWVALAGPGTNLLLAIVSSLLLQILIWFDPNLVNVIFGSGRSLSMFESGLQASVLVPIAYMLVISVKVNILLMLFNLLPIPPLDGGRVAVGLLPHRPAAILGQLEIIGLPLIALMVFFDPLGLMARYFWPLVQYVSNVILIG
ncbi:MAG: site-2 protease family protein [Nitrospirae bacterium]|nr:site-2 protease family protein [Nitrospirota bacterium]